MFKPSLILSLSVYIYPILININLISFSLVIHMDPVPAYMNLSILIFYMNAPEAYMDIILLFSTLRIFLFILLKFPFCLLRLRDFILCLKQFIQRHFIKPCQHNKIICVGRCLCTLPLTHRLSADPKLFCQRFLGKVMALP